MGKSLGIKDIIKDIDGDASLQDDDDDDKKCDDENVYKESKNGNQMNVDEEMDDDKYKKSDDGNVYEEENFVNRSNAEEIPSCRRKDGKYPCNKCDKLFAHIGTRNRHIKGIH